MRAENPQPPQPRAICFHQVFERRARLHPGADAVVTPGGASAPRRLSYGAVDRAADHLAGELRRRGVGPETVVGLALERSPEMVIALLAILKAGGAYLPLDPSYPAQRLGYMVRDAGIPLLVTAGDAADGLPPEVPRFDLGGFDADRFGSGESRDPGDGGDGDDDDDDPAADACPHPAHLAYVIYTSGSTGRPKGVMVSHRGLAGLAAAQREAFDVSPDSRVLLFAPISFDASVFEMLMAFHAGAALCVTPRRQLIPGPEFADLLAEERITHLTIPPSALAAVPRDVELPDLRVLVCAGEALPPALVRHWAPGRRMFNAYGPTEATVWTTVARCAADGEPPPIGRAIAGVQVMRLQPGTVRPADGDTGELAIGGPSLARGYLGRPARTAAAFVPDPRSGEPGARVYRTGDLVRRRSDGSLEFAGRIDDQVKVRGFRIEPGEVRVALEGHPAVRTGYVAVQGEGDDALLAAYAVLEEGERGASGAGELMAHLRDALPGHMVPAGVVLLDEIPTTPNGKVDRDALPPLERAGKEIDGEPPRGATEEAVAAIWCQLLGVEAVARDDDFFELGGHSLLVGQLISRLRREFDVETPMARVFAEPTVAALAAFIDGRSTAAGPPPPPPVRRAPRDRALPLSFPQERVWFLNELAPGNVAYNSQATIRFRGTFDPGAFRLALCEIVRRHEAFRTRFPAVDGTPLQEVLPPMAVELPVIDLSGLPEQRREGELDAVVGRIVTEPFDVLHPPLARWRLLRLADDDNAILQVEHHFVHDGWSFGVLMDEIRQLYAAFARGRPSPLPEPPMQVADYAVWQREWLRGEVLEQFLDFWTDQVSGSPPVLEMPTDRPRPRQQSFRGRCPRVELPAELSRQLRAMARREGWTLYTAMMAVFVVFLHRYSHQDDFLVGTAAANRRLREMEEMIGMAVNTQLMRTDASGSPTFRELAERIHRRALAAWSYQEMPLDKLVERVAPERDLSRNPLFQVFFNFHDSPVPDMRFDELDLRGEIVERHNGSAKADLNVVVIPRAEQRRGRAAGQAAQEEIVLLWEYAIDLYDATTTHRMVGHYRNLLAAAVAEPGRPIAALPMLTGVERHQLLVGWNDTATGRSREGSTWDRFATLAEATPDATAVEEVAPPADDGAAVRRSLTYGELADEAARLATRLGAAGVVRGSLVAVSMHRSADWVVALLAILRAGGAYVPLDPAYPAQRLAFMLADTAAPVVLMEEATRGRLEAALGEASLEPAPRLIDVATAAEETGGTAEAAGPAPPVATTGDDLAYVIYTSGSTGRPKGVAVPQRAVDRLVRGVDYVELGPSARLGGVSNASFDAATLELWGALLTGGCLVLVERDDVLSPRRLAAVLGHHRVSTMFMTVALFNQVAQEEPRAFASMRDLLVGGEAVDPQWMGEVLRQGPPARLHNGYGPTETTTFAATHHLAAPPPEGRAVPIGRPIADTVLHVVDRNGRPVPIGVHGELWIGGTGLAWGYLGRPARTARSFVPDPFSATPGARLYRTGDLVRRRSDGAVEFLGRLDHQVKVRGFRIELGEIETALAAHPAVAECAVLAREDTPGERRLVAYTVTTGAVDGDELTAYLEQRLPPYMVPAAQVSLEAMPLNANGKVDRGALPAPEQAAGGGGAAPSGPIEELVAAIWEAVLGVSGVGAGDDFFDLGGHSLLATKVNARLHEALGVELPLSTLFEESTVRRLAAAVDVARRSGDGVEDARPAEPVRPLPEGHAPPLSFAQERLWFLDRLVPDLTAYNIARAWRVDGALDPGALAAALGRLTRRHRVLAATFPEVAGAPVHRVEPPSAAPRPLPLIDLAGLDADRARREAAALARADADRPFPLETGPLLRRTLIRLGRERHVLLLVIHHIVADGWSLQPLLRDLGALYDEVATGEAAELPELPVQYPDYAAWQRRHFDADALDRLLDHWRDALRGAPLALELPTDRPRPDLQSFRGGHVRVRLGTEVRRRLDDVARRLEATPFLVLSTAWAVHLHRLSGQDDLLFGTPVAGRERRELEEMVGLFVNTLTLRSRLRRDDTFAALVARARTTLLDAHDHQDLPFERLVEELAPDRDLSRSPIYQALFSMQATGRTPLTLGGAEAQRFDIERRTSHFDLTLFATLDDGGVELVLAYDRALFDLTTARRFAAGLRTLTTAALDQPDRRAVELPVLTAAGRHQVLHAWNDTAVPVDTPHLLHRGFEEQVARRPEAAAVIWSGGTVTYGEVETRANRLAHLLRHRGVGRGTPVGVHLRRSPRMVVAVLAVLKAGGTYVPLEHDWPAERVRWIVAEHGIRHLLVERSTVGTLARWETVPPLETVITSGTPEALDPEVAGVLDKAGIQLLPALGTGGVSAFPGDRPPDTVVDGDDRAYVIFTSGSTGRPKGVVVRHRPAVNLVRWVNRTFGVGPRDRLLFITALSFDLSVYDVFGTLAAGATVRLAVRDEVRDPQRLVEMLVEEPITFWNSAPTALQQCAPYFPPPATVETDLRLVFLSGDWIPVQLPDRVRRAFTRSRVIGLGGATEATVWSNVYPVGRVDPSWSSIPYGRPIDNARYHVLDGELQPVPVGVAGNLYIGGDCLSDGYADNPRQTALQYRPDPLSRRPGDRLYATGDRARLRPDGVILFLGRLDRQVKVRGFRIELGEIEAVLRELPEIGEVVVMAREDTPGDQRLVAYLQLHAGRARPEPSDLREHAGSRLPGYMVPSAWVVVDSWPLAPTGKLDRDALPAPEEAADRLAPTATAEEGAAAEGAAPRPAAAAPALRPSTLEKRIADLWCDVLGVDEVGRDESFFDLGGHSLLMAKVHRRLQDMVQRKISMVHLFRHPTVASLASSLVSEGLVEAEEPSLAEQLSAARDRAATPGTTVGAVAIVGLAGRFPGADGVEALWDLLCAGREGIRRFDDDELTAAGVDPELLDDPRYVKARGALEGADRFDADFFSMTPREAQITDPQQRLLLEIAWQALEDAGYDPGRVDAPVGVFAGVSSNRYLRHVEDDGELMRAVGPFQVGLANHPDYVATRLAYKMDLTGPALTVQTACSTSLVAVHLAARSLLAGECDLALAGGASVHAPEVKGYLHFEGGVDSPDGHTRAFDADAAGVVNGSGAGMVVLKRLDDARADGDTIRAVLRGSALNNDGAAKVGFTAPSEEGQAEVITEALAAAGVDPSDVGYVEAHGTGTPLGDPIEVAGLHRAFGNGSTLEHGHLCALGSIKTNIGHLDAAAGVAGLIKATLAVERGRIPPSLHFRRPNPELGLDDGPFFVADRLLDWPLPDGPRRAGVSSFGIGGTNVHAVLEQAPPAEPSPEPPRPAQLLVLSGATPAALGSLAARLADHLERLDGDGGVSAAHLADVAWTLQSGRRPLRQRRAVACRSAAAAVEALRGGDDGGHGGGAASPPPPVVFLFPGQGAQFPGMGEELYSTEPVFRETVDRAAELLQPELDLDLRRVLFPVEDGEEAARRLRRTDLAQPALFTYGVALERLWRSWGVRPASVAGHSVGELAAACAAGVFSFEDGLRLTVARGRLMQQRPGGDMLGVALPADDLEARLDGHPEVALAAVNGPRACVVSGPAEAVERLAAGLADEGIEHRPLHTSHAFHSASMDPVVEDFTHHVETVHRNPPKIPLVSAVTGAPLSDGEATSPAYWGRQLRAPVNFAAALDYLLDEGPRALVEAGPGRTLTTFARQHPASDRIATAARSLPHPRESGGDLDVLLPALGALWCAGVEVDWNGVAGPGRRRVPLPTYPFQRRRHTVETLAPAYRLHGDEPEEDAVEDAVEAAGGDPAAAPGSGSGDAETATERAVAEVWRDLLGIDRVRRGDDFFDLGGSSLMGVQLARRLDDRLGVELTGDYLLEASTLSALAALIDETREAADSGAPRRESSCLVRLQRADGGHSPLFLVHQVGGHVYTYRDLARHVGDRQPLYALRSPGLEAGEEPLSDVEAMAAHYLELVRGEQPRGPYYLGGASMGGMVAFDMARRLTRDGEQVALLTLMDTPCGDQMPEREDAADAVAVVVEQRAGVRLDPAELRAAAGAEDGLDPDALFDLALDRLDGRGSAGDGDGWDEAAARRAARVLTLNAAALYAYEPEPWDGEILYFRAAERRAADPPRPELPWIELARDGCEVLVVPGDHMSMHEEENLGDMARRLRRKLG